jgi:hypothetical protein
MICERCGQHEASPQQCPGDKAWHRHGAVHTLPSGLEHVCHECIKDIRIEWLSRRAAGDPTDPRGDNPR